MGSCLKMARSWALFLRYVASVVPFFSPCLLTPDTQHLLNPAKGAAVLKRLKDGAMKETLNRWDENWDKVAAPVFGLH